MMKWERLEINKGGPGKRWGHTCNAVRGGQLLYIFGGYGEDNAQSNKVHVFDTIARTWSEPDMKGTLPVPRDSHSCTTVGDKLFVFGGTDGSVPLKDLHVLDTSTNTWMAPFVRGDGPEAREGHSAALIGKRLFIFGGSGKSVDTPVEELFDDLYILNTETMVWKRVATTGIPPTKRNSHTCVSWKNKIIVIGGEDTQSYYLSDVHMLDTDNLTWTKLVTNGELLPPRAGHTTIALGKYLFVFGGFTDAEDLYDDLYMFDLETFKWTKVTTLGVGPSARFSMAGGTLHPQHGGVLIFIGGCNKTLEALDDMFYLHTGLVIENERDDRKLEKLSLRKQLRLKSQEHQSVNPGYDTSMTGMDTSSNANQPVTMSAHADGQNIYLNEYQNANGKRTFQAKVTKNITNCYTIETVIDGKPLRGVLFSNNVSNKKPGADDLRRKRVAVDSGKKSYENIMGDNSRSPEHQTPGATSAASDMKTPAASNVSPPHELAGLQRKVRSQVSSEYMLSNYVNPAKQLFDWGMMRLPRHPYGVADAFAVDSDNHLKKKRERLTKLEEEETNRLETRKRKFFAEILNGIRELQLQVLASLKRRKQQNDAVQAWHGRQRQRATRQEKLRFQALKSDDQEAYMRMVEESKNERLTMLLGKTNDLLVRLGAVVRRQKDAEHDGIEPLNAPQAEVH